MCDLVKFQIGFLKLNISIFNILVLYYKKTPWVTEARVEGQVVHAAVL